MVWLKVAVRFSAPPCEAAQIKYFEASSDDALEHTIVVMVHNPGMEGVTQPGNTTLLRRKAGRQAVAHVRQTVVRRSRWSKVVIQCGIRSGKARNFEVDVVQ
jgi:DNA-binding sugar fermentation-stimulating protein